MKSLGYIGYGTHWEKYNGFSIHGPFVFGYEIIAAGMRTKVQGLYSILEAKKMIDSGVL